MFHRELADRVERGTELHGIEIRSEADLSAVRDEYYTWDEYNTQLLRRRFTSEELVDAYRDHFFVGTASERSLGKKISEVREEIQTKVRRLRSISEQVDLFEVDASVKARVEARSVKKDAAPPAIAQVFVVHGQNETVKLQIVDFLERLIGQRPVVLHEHPSEGRTLIEKLEHYAGASTFAVVLLTADDEGRLRGSEGPLLPRGRQNVVLELGYFMAMLGRSRVVLIYESEVELPSDMTGIVYTRFDPAGGWKLALARELRAAGVDVNVNNTL